MYSKAFLALLASSLVSAQTYTACDPTKKDCPPDPAVAGTEVIDFTQGDNTFFKVADGTKLTFDGSKGAVFSINKETDAPTIASPEYIFFGKLEVELEAAPGAGIVTSVVLQSDDLDEIDWEWVGGSPDKVQSNYFSKGDTTTYDRGGTHDCPNAVGTFHTYTVDWTKEAITWSIDGTAVRTLTYNDAKGGATYPQTPMQVKVGTWVAGKKDAPQGTVEWSGGYANFDNAPIQAFYKKVTVTDYMGGTTGAKSYVYSDRTGTWQSIKIDTENGAISGNSTDSDSSSSSAGSATETSTETATTLKPTSSATTTGSGTGSPSSTGSGSGSSETDAPGAAPKTGLALAGVALSGVALLMNFL